MDAIDKRYMFDTSAISRIMTNYYDEMIIYQSKKKGYEYYFTEIQSTESYRNIVKTTDGISENLVERERAERATGMLKIIAKIQTRRVGEIATFRQNRWLLNGTFEVLPSGEGAAAAMFNDILHDNDFKYYNDAMIAMVAIVNGCVVVAEDRRLLKKVSNHFPGRAIKYDDFICLLKTSCADSTIQQ